MGWDTGKGSPKRDPAPPSPSQLRIQLCNVRELKGSEAAHSGGGDGQTGGPRPAAEAAASRPPGCLAPRQALRTSHFTCVRHGVAS